MTISKLGWACILVLLLSSVAKAVVVEGTENNRFFAMVAGGKKGATGTTTAIVFENYDDGKQFRPLFKKQLLSFPAVHSLSEDGRFLITMDTVTGELGPHSLVIYDLVREEHTAYPCSDFLSPHVLKGLREGQFVDREWHYSSGYFNRSSTLFYPTMPKNCRKEGLPFIVAKLPSRKVVTSAEVPKSVSNIAVYDKVDWGGCRTIVEIDTVRYFRFLEHGVPRGLNPHPNPRYYQIDTRTKKYIRVDKNKIDMDEFKGQSFLGD